MYYAYFCKNKNSPITNFPHKFDTIVKAREYGVKRTADGGVVKIYSRDPFRWMSVYGGFQYPFFEGYVQYNTFTKEYDWNTPRKHDGKVLLSSYPNGEVLFKLQNIYKNGKIKR